MTYMPEAIEIKLDRIYISVIYMLYSNKTPSRGFDISSVERRSRIRRLGVGIPTSSFSVSTALQSSVKLLAQYSVHSRNLSR